MSKTESLIREMLEIADDSSNKADHPINISYGNGLWWVFVEVDMPRGTFDLESKSRSLEWALRNILPRIRGELRDTQ